MIKVTNKTHVNDNSNNIMFGMQHNLRHFHGEVGLTENNILNYLLDIINNEYKFTLTRFWTKSSI